MSKHSFSEIRIPIEKDNPAIQRQEEKCIKCGQCRRICENDIAVGKMYDLESTGDKAICIHCGQCAAVCPVDSITEVYEYPRIRTIIKEGKKTVIFSTSPSVRVALGEEFGLPAGTFVETKVIGALKRLGASYVLDTNFAADLTIMEEAAELVARLEKKTAPLPQFTSCCPAWIKFVETFYPEFIPNLSTAKSPIGMQGPTIKTYFANQTGISSQDIINVAVTPCTAKKFEIRREEMNDAALENGIENMRDMDFVITTKELALWMKEEGLDLQSITESPYDKLMGEASGAAVIFGNSGGVMEAAARTAYHMVTGENPPADFYNLKPVRGIEGRKEAEITIEGVTLKIAVIHGTANAQKLLEEIKRGEKLYDFIEVMTCKGGCIGGGGQPKTEIPVTEDILQARIASLYAKDNACAVRLSHENPDIKAVYQAFYEHPLSEKAEKMLHTEYFDKSKDLGPQGKILETQSASLNTSGAASTSVSYKCKICGYVHDGELPDGFVCPICKQGTDAFILA